jgi:NADH:ubiquinone oxidoreductase subunit 6 (subunit J)
MADSKEGSSKGAEHTHFHGIAWVDEEAPLTDVEIGSYTNKRKVTWSQLRRTAPDLYIVSLIIFFFGIAVVISVPISVVTGTQIPFIPPELLALGSTLMLIIGALIIFFGFRLIRREREAWSMTMLLLVFVLIAASSRAPSRP